MASLNRKIIETMIKNQMEIEEVKSMVIEEMNAFDEFISTINTVKKKKRVKLEIGQGKSSKLTSMKHKTITVLLRAKEQ